MTLKRKLIQGPEGQGGVASGTNSSDPAPATSHQALPPAVQRAIEVDSFAACAKAIYDYNQGHRCVLQADRCHSLQALNAWGPEALVASLYVVCDI